MSLPRRSSSRRRSLALGAALLALAALAGCAGAGSKTAAATATVVPCDFDAPASSVSINVLAYNSSAIDPFTNSMVRSCSKDGVAVQHDPIDFGGQYTKTPITLAAPKGKGTFDIVEGYSAMIPAYADKGELLPLDDLFAKYEDKYDLGGLDQEMLDGMTYDGKLYGLPMQANVSVMVYRKDILDDLGIAPPTTYDELIDAAKKIQGEGDMEYPLAMPASDPSTAYEQVMASLGIEYVDSDGKPTFDNPEATAGLQAMVDLAPFMDPQATTFDQPKVQQQLMNGKAALAVMFSGRMADLVDPDNTPYAEDFGFAAPPAVDPGGRSSSAISVDGFTIAANSEIDPELLFQVIASSVTKEASVVSMPDAFPARSSVITGDRIPYLDAIQGALDDGAALPSMQPWFTTMEDLSYAPLLKAWAGEESVADALAESQKAAEKALAGR